MRELGRRRLEVLAEFKRAWAAQDIDGLMSLMADDCVYSSSVGAGPGNTFRGRDAVRAGFLGLLEYEDTGRLEEDDPWLLVGDRAVSTWTHVVVDVDGTRTVTRGCDLWEFTGDKIAVKDAFRKSYR